MRSFPTKASRFRYPAGPLPDFRMWESCWTMPLADGFSQGTPDSPTLTFERRLILESHFMFRDDGHLRLPAGKPVTRRVSPRPGSTPHAKIFYFLQTTDTLAACDPPRRGAAVHAVDRAPASHQAEECSIPGRVAPARGNLTGRHHWSASLLRDLPFIPPLRSGAAPYSPHFTLIGSRDLVANKNVRNRSTPQSPRKISRGPRCEKRIDLGSQFRLAGNDVILVDICRLALYPVARSCRCVVRGEGNQDVCTVYRRSELAFASVTSANISNKRVSDIPSGAVLRTATTATICCAARDEFLHERVNYTHDCVEPGSIPGGFAPGFSHVGIVLDDAAGQRVFFGIMQFPPAFHSGAAPYTPSFNLIGSQDLDVKSRPIRFTSSRYRTH
ncbi:hypothetical protein PR048_019138 [Dryococelus australis]|uniref:Uncharacterized protein n=1 Tax=Dryococelus australis TaxID=614101 RepID=A0ABQ9H2R1_9NEOP|nr:hypothetical protein PR048_019138 [Dryococelus australis]